MDFESDLGTVWLVLVLVIGLHAMLLARRVVGLVDPLVVTSIGTTTAVTMAFALTGPSLELLRVICCVLLFWVGLRATWRRQRPAPALLAGRDAGEAARQAAFVRLVAIATIVYVLANVLFFIVVGAPALAENPTLAKVDSYAGGFGVVRRINWGLGIFVVVGLMYLLLTTRPRWAKWACAGYVVISALSGSKSALVPLVLAFALFNGRADLRAREKLPHLRLTWLLPVLVLAALGIGIGVLVVETGDVTEALYGFVIRLLYSSDVLFYWENPDIQHFFRALDPLDYIVNVLNPILGGFRLVDYQQPIGSVMVQQSLGVGTEVSESLGPNVPFYVKGEMFFGVCQFPYCFAIGALIGWMRARFAAIDGGHPLKLCLFGTVVLLSPALSIDDTLFLSQLFDFATLFAVVWLIASAWPARPMRPLAVAGTTGEGGAS